MNNLTSNQKTLIAMSRKEDPNEAFTNSPVRFWGLEVEHPRAGQFAYLTRGSYNLDIWEAKQDSTVPNVDDGSNLCECNECSHRCDCHRCNYRNERCQTSRQNEVAFAPTNHHEPSKLRRYLESLTDTPADFPQSYCHGCDDYLDSDYCDYCDEYAEEQEQNWGYHVHIDGRGLNFRQVASVVRLGTYAMKQWSDAFGADQDTYNGHATDEYIADIQAGRCAWRQSVNASPIVRYLNETHESDQTGSHEYPRTASKSTIEFRSFRATPNADLVLARANFARAVVDYVKSGKPVFWLLRETDFEKFLAELELPKH